jgi:tetratricopeptide repeat protein 21B
MAAQQLEFLRELSSAIDKSPELSYLSAVVAKEQQKPAEMILKYLTEALDTHFNRMRGLAFNLSYLKLINPDLVLKIVREYLFFAPQEVMHK